MWNLLELQCPTSDMVEYLPDASDQIGNLRNFVTVLTAAADTLTSDDPLWKELHVFKNFQAKYKRILRCDKCLIYLHRVSHCLKKMVLLNLSKNYLDLAERFLGGFKDDGGIVSLPSRQQVEFVLLRTQSAAKLVSEAVEYSQDTFCFLIQKIKVGHLLLDLVTVASATARLNILLKGILVLLCETYKKVLTWRLELKAGSHQWQEELKLPSNLEEWVSLSTPCSNRSISPSKLETLFITAENTENDVTVIEEPNQSFSGYSAANNSDMDYGEVISREKEYADYGLTSMQKKSLQKILSASNCATIQDIWDDLSNLDPGELLITLTPKKKKIISKFLKREKKKERLNKSSPQVQKFDVHDAGIMFAKYLGFTQSQVDACRSIKTVSEKHQRSHQQIKKFKELKALYQDLSERLISTGRTVIHKKLKKIFTQKIFEIKLLKESGQKQDAKKLIRCTQQVMLTLCKE